jgi:hypothetical protein
MLTPDDLVKMAANNPYRDNGCPICGEHAVSSCRCIGPHSLDKLASGHGLKCPNGHRWSGDLAYDATKQAEEEVQPEQRNPLRKAVDAVTNGAVMAGGALAAGVSSIKSLDTKAPVKTIN